MHICLPRYVARNKKRKKRNQWSLVTGLNFQGCLFTRIDLYPTIVSTLLGHLDEQIEAGVIEATKASNIDNPTRG